MSELTQRIRDLKMRALIVDDSKAMRLIIRNVLGEVGFDIIEASHGGEALDLLRQNPGIQIVLVDWHMPGGGLSVLDHLEGRDDFEGVAVLMSGDIAEEPWKKLGPRVKRLRKPFRMPEIVPIVEGEPS